MNRLLAPAPADWTGLTYDGAVAVNEVDIDGTPNVAVYFDGDAPITEQEWADYVSAYSPPPAPTGPSLDDVAATIQASADLPAEVKDALLAVITTVQTTMTAAPLGPVT